MSDAAIRVGVIGGSGLYEIEELTDRREVTVDTPFGPPSDRLLVGRLEGLEVAFLPRHGRGHRLLPTELNFRANIWALKSLGVEWIISASAVGSLDGNVRPLDVVVPDQFIDRTRHRVDTFFGDGLVAHVSLADPVCSVLRGVLVESLREVGARVHDGGTYLCMEGPQFSTRAESNLYRAWGATVIGMTNLQEARLAREAEICYATLALVTDWDCWKDDEDPVSVDAVVERLGRNARTARETVRRAVGRLPERRECACARALDTAIITPRELVPEETIRRLGPVVARVLGR
ncbi:MAG: S-methyl-5'-thioadenosine phosphorylase [Acidobacteria bacterium]|nr:MAG: S-methyl-5'-thioadenosine phosphorylase [Acidobacteriota bacterium]